MGVNGRSDPLNEAQALPGARLEAGILPPTRCGIAVKLPTLSFKTGPLGVPVSWEFHGADSIVIA